jgi:hypothetical protein
MSESPAVAQTLDPAGDPPVDQDLPLADDLSVAFDRKAPPGSSEGREYTIFRVGWTSSVIPASYAVGMDVIAGAALAADEQLVHLLAYVC